MAHRVPSIAVEPLSERTWTEIEAKVFERLDESSPPVVPNSRRGFPAWGAATLAALAMAASVFAVIRVSQWDGMLRTHPVANGARIPTAAEPSGTESASAGPLAPLTQHIVTTARSTMANLGDSRLVIAEHSEILISGNEQDGWRVLLEAGEVGCEVPPRRGRPEFMVQAGDVVVRVVGTKFDVIRSAAGTRVAVHRGRVSVEHAGSQNMVGEGESWTRPVPSPRTQNTRPSKVHAPKTEAPARREPEAKLSARDEFERAASLESANPSEALRIYRRLFDEGGPWAANALYARARLLLERGARSDARRQLERYAELYPRGINAADVRRLLKRYSPNASK